MKKIAFRADACGKLGTGDLISLVNLSKYFEKAGWETHFIIKGHAEALDIVNKRAVKNCRVLSAGSSLEEEVREINNYVDTAGIDAVFFEITERMLTEYSGLGGRAAQACVNFDGVIHERVGLVVNWDDYSSGIYDRKKYPKTRFLLGMEYAPLPVEFDFDRVGRRSYSGRPKNILITMGGCDGKDLTRVVACALAANLKGLRLDIVIGSGYPFRDGLEKELKALSADYRIEKNVTDMFSRFMDCDAAVSAGGFSSIELVAARTPLFLIAAYEHQVPRCEYFSRMGYATYLGYCGFDEKTLVEALNAPAKIPPKKRFDAGAIVSSTYEMLKRH